MVKINIQSLDGGLWVCELLVRCIIMLCCYEFPPSFNLDSFFASFGKHYSEIARPPRRGHNMPPRRRTEKPLTQRSFIFTTLILERKPLPPFGCGLRRSSYTSSKVESTVRSTIPSYIYFIVYRTHVIVVVVVVVGIVVNSTEHMRAPISLLTYL